MKKLLPYIAILVILVLGPSSAFASSFYMTGIGAMDVTGSSLNHYWYTSANPSISGHALPSEEVTVTVDGTASTTTADTNGAWNRQITADGGDHEITIKSASSEPHTFTLTIGDVPEGVGAITPSDVPTAGNMTPTFLFLGLSLFFLTSSFVFRKAGR